MKVYIAGPYTGDERANVDHMTDIYNELIDMGHFPYSPLLSSHFAAERRAESGKEPFSYETWMRLDLSFLSVCDAMFFMGESPGANTERMVAELLGIPVYYDLMVLELL